MTIRPFFWDVISLLQVSLIDIRTSFPQGSVQSDLNQALIISSLRAYSAYLSESRSSLKELLFEYDTLVSIFLTRFEYSTVVEAEAAQFHSEIYKLLVNAKVKGRLDEKNSASVIQEEDEEDAEHI